MGPMFFLASKSPRKFGLNKLGFDNFPYLTVTNLRKNPFYALLSRVEPLDLFSAKLTRYFWRVNIIFEVLDVFQQLEVHWFFGNVFGQIGFLALTNFRCPFLKNEDRCSKIGRPLFGTHTVNYISKLSFTETPKTVVGGDKVRDKFWNIRISVLH